MQSASLALLLLLEPRFVTVAAAENAEPASGARAALVRRAPAMKSIGADRIGCAMPRASGQWR